MLPKSWMTRLLCAGFAAGTLSCGSDKLVLPDQGRVTKVAAVGGDAQSGTAGAALTDDLTVLVTDALGRPVVGQAVVFTPLGAGNGSVDPDTVITDGEGHATTQWVLGTAAGAQRVQAAPIVDGALDTELAIVFTATAEAGNAARLAFLVQPSAVVAGVVMAPAVKVEVQDQNGNRVTGATTPVALAIATNPSGGTLSGGGSVNAVDGVATFSNLSINKSGAGYTLTASASGFTAATSAGFTVNAAAPDHLEWTLSSSVAAGATIPSAQVTVRDALGNVVTTPSLSITVAIQNNPSGGTLSGTKTVTTTNGVAAFTNLSIDRTGNGYTLLASGGSLSVVSGALNIIPGGSNRLAFQVQPSSSTVGATLSTVQVSVLDANGNLVTSATNSITLVSSDAGTLSGTTTVSASGGIAQFTNLRVTQAGTGYTLRAFSSGLADATSNAFDIAKGATTIDITSRSPATSTVGQAVTVNYDVDVTAPASGNLSGSVTVSDGTTSCVGGVTNAGSGSCVLTFTTAGTRTLTATYAGDLNFTGSASASVSHPVNKASPPLNITADSPDPSRVGQPVTVQWTFNAAGVPATGSVVVTMAGDAATCTAPIGDGSCQLSPTTPGTGTQRVITAAYDGDDNYNGDTDTENHTVQVATTTTTITSLDPSPSQLLQPVTVSFTVVTGSGPAPTGTVSVRVDGVEKCTATVAEGSCQIPGAAFGAGGTFTISANYPGDAQHASSADSKEQVVSNAAPTATDDAQSMSEDGGPLAVAAPGVLQNDTDPDAGTTLTATLVAGPTHASAFTLHPDGSFSYTPAANFNGTDSFTYRAGDGENTSNIATVTITVNPVNDAPSFTKGANVSRTADITGQQSIAGWATNISAGPADESGQALTFQVASNDNPALFAVAPAVSADGTLTFTLAGTPGTANLAIRLTDDGGTANDGVDASATQTFSVTVSVGSGTHLVFLAQPANSVVGATLGTVQVAVRDAVGNLVTTATNSITLTSSPGTLGGTTTVAASGGIAQFSNLRITAAGTGYTLQASGSGLTDATSTAFNVAKGGTSVAITDRSPSTSTVGQAVTVSYDVDVTAPASGDLSGSVTVSDGLSSCVGSVDAAGSGSCSLSLLVAGTRSLTATYGGDGNFESSVSSAASQVVTVLNTAPTANADAASVNEDEALSVPAPGVLQNDTDAQDDNLSAVLVTGPAHASAFQLHADGSFAYTPEADFNGTDSFTYQASDGALQSGTVTVTITVNSVNDAPSFTKGADVTVTTADGAQTIAGWATNLSAGPANESGQALTFQVSNDNAALFAPGSEPTIDPDGTLHFTPSGVEGTATVTVQLSDNGGTANGGTDASASQTFAITVGPPAP